MDDRRITIPDLLSKKVSGRKITMLTAYDYPLASLIAEAGVDLLLVGDSLGNVALGYDSTVSVTMEEMLHHSRAVRRAAPQALIVADMPFLSYQISGEQSIANAGRLIQTGGADAVKVEGGNRRIAGITAAIIACGIPVMGHVGLTPQSAVMLGGYKVQGKDSENARRIVEEALALEQAGCFSVVLECLPAALAEFISRRLKVPTIGIGSGSGCDGQVLVTHDLLGLTARGVPRFVKQYADLRRTAAAALREFLADVEERRFPAKEQAAAIDPAIIRGLADVFKETS
ncbi:MAG: 3-methyl-2-oxobutanoate hydroxymethyltransferase [Candidatus Omnitrophica bacterium]|nr:3-methyl-2-oxobutanoate hydroxymethyltransferase [Candidatus Omnitrophota bacterium]